MSGDEAAAKNARHPGVLGFKKRLQDRQGNKEERGKAADTRATSLLDDSNVSWFLAHLEELRHLHRQVQVTGQFELALHEGLHRVKLAGEEFDVVF